MSIDAQIREALQKVGAALNLRPGDDLTTKCLPSIARLKAAAILDTGVSSGYSTYKCMACNATWVDNNVNHLTDCPAGSEWA